MVEGPVARSGGRVIRVAVAPAEIYSSLQGFEACVSQAAEVLAGEPGRSA
jgi:hypothetical protein